MVGNFRVFHGIMLTVHYGIMSELQFFTSLFSLMELCNFTTKSLMNKIVKIPTAIVLGFMTYCYSPGIYDVTHVLYSLIPLAHCPLSITEIQSIVSGCTVKFLKDVYGDEAGLIRKARFKKSQFEVMSH